MQELDAVLTTEGYLLRLVDKKHPLPETFVPKHLVPVREQWLFFSKGRSLLLTKIAYEALHQLIQAAARDGVALSVGSAYRSFAYQKKLFSWYAQEHGMQEAMRFFRARRNKSAPVGDGSGFRFYHAGVCTE